MPTGCLNYSGRVPTRLELVLPKFLVKTKPMLWSTTGRLVTTTCQGSLRGTSYLHRREATTTPIFGRTCYDVRLFNNLSVMWTTFCHDNPHNQNGSSPKSILILVAFDKVSSKMPQHLRDQWIFWHISMNWTSWVCSEILCLYFCFFIKTVWEKLPMELSTSSF